MRLLTRKLREIERKYRGGNVFQLTMKDGTRLRLPVDQACVLILKNNGAVADVTAPEEADNGILPELLKAVVTDGS